MNAATLTPDQARELLQRTRAELGRAVVGQQRLLDRVLVALLSGGHCLLEGVPGIGKTLTVASLARTLGGSFTRIQFTPDLIPSDIVGTRIYRPSTERFDVELGPIFTNFLLADEINRAPAKVQSALLEVMQEQQVTIGRDSFAVPAPFLVLATQNPIEQDGTYPLPEAQVDRFMMKVLVDYPNFSEEMGIVARSLAEPPPGPRGAVPGPARRPPARHPVGVRGPAGGRVRGGAVRRDPPPGRLPAGGVGPLPGLRGLPAGLDQPGGGRAGAGGAARARLRAAPGRAGAGP